MAGTLFTFAFHGSSQTLVKSTVAGELGVTGDAYPLYLQWPSGIERMEDESQLIQFQISGTIITTRFDLTEVHTIKSLNLPVQLFYFSELSRQLPHLQGLPVLSYTGAVPTISIGLDNSLVMAARKSRVKGRPIAVGTRLDWADYGSTSSDAERSVHPLFHISVCSTDQLRNPNKVRLVWYAAAKIQGQSFNAALIT